MAETSDMKDKGIWKWFDFASEPQRTRYLPDPLGGAVGTLDQPPMTIDATDTAFTPSPAAK